jgi:hypothetical protein
MRTGNIPFTMVFLALPAGRFAKATIAPDATRTKKGGEAEAPPPAFSFCRMEAYEAFMFDDTLLKVLLS